MKLLTTMALIIPMSASALTPELCVANLTNDYRVLAALNDLVDGQSELSANATTKQLIDQKEVEQRYRAARDAIYDGVMARENQCGNLLLKN